MNIALVPYLESQLNNNIFNKNSSFVDYSFTQIREKFKENGIEFNTIDKYESINSVNYILFFAFYPHLPMYSFQGNYYEKCIELGLHDKLIYLAWEPEVVDLRHSPNGLWIIKQYFKYIMTWNDDLVDNDRVFKMNWPYFFSENKFGHTGEKKLLTNISGYKFSDINNELYTERLKVINFFETLDNDVFDFYGRGWPENTFKNYKGAVENKFETYSKYKFALCLENMKNVKGYITEKIYDCFVGNIVPIYLGASDITNYIPADCFIDYSKFNDINELYTFLENVTENEYNQYLSNIRNYLNSKSKKYASPEVFVSCIFEVINNHENSYI